MKPLRRYKNLRATLLLATILLAAQTLFFWHSHHGKVTPDDACQICLHAQHHTPATHTIQTTAVALFLPITISQPQVIDTFHPLYRISSPSRGPPAFSLA